MAKPHCAALTQEALIQALEGLLGLGDECLHADESSAAMEATQKLLKPHAAAIILGLQRVIQQQHTPAKRPSGAAQRMKVAPHKVLGLILVCAGHHTQPSGQTVQAHLHHQSPCQVFSMPASRPGMYRAFHKGQQHIGAGCTDRCGKVSPQLLKGTAYGPRAADVAGLHDVRPADAGDTLASTSCAMPACFVCCPGLVVMWTDHVCRQSSAQCPVSSHPCGMREAARMTATP